MKPVGRRILHVSTFAHPDQHGGAERVVHGLATAQAMLGHRVTLLTGNHDRRPARETRDGIEVRRYPLPAGRRGLGFYRAVSGACARALRALAAQPFDVLHAHQVASAAVALGARRVASRHIFSFYAPYAQEMAVGRADDWRQRLLRRGAAWLDRRCLRRADRVIVLSDFSRGQVQELTPEVLSRVVKIYPGVTIERFSAGPAATARAHLGITVDRPLLVTVRRLVHRMGIDLLLRAVRILQDRGMAVSVMIGGEGPDRAALEALRAELGLQDSVTFLGRVADADLPDLYRAADLFVLPTRALEGFGMVTLEALACGVPVLATDVGATGEVLRNLLPDVPPVPADAAALADGIARVLGDPQARAAAANAALHIQRDYDWRACARLTDRVYADALRGPDRP